MRDAARTNGLMEIPVRIATWRAHLGLTLQEASRRAGIKLSCLAQAETGYRTPRSGNLKAIVERGFGITMAKFWGALPKVRPSTGPKVGRPRTWRPSAGARARTGARA